jgi:chemotaxis protein histidine kinase CheA
MDLIALENEPDSRPLLVGVFRAIHTIKGICGFLPLPHLERVTHVWESLLAQLRNGQLVLTPEMVAVLLRLADVDPRSSLARSRRTVKTAPPTTPTTPTSSRR